MSVQVVITITQAGEDYSKIEQEFRGFDFSTEKERLYARFLSSLLRDELAKCSQVILRKDGAA